MVNGDPREFDARFGIDPKAWLNDCIKEHQAQLTRLLRRYVGEHDADDLLNETWLKLHREITRSGAIGWSAEYRRRWLITTAKHLAIDHLRREGREAAKHQARGEAGLAPVDLSQANERDAARWWRRDADDAQDDDRRERLQAGIAQLPEKDRADFVGYHLENRPVKEIAQKHGITKHGVYKRLAKATVKLLAILL